MAVTENLTKTIGYEVKIHKLHHKYLMVSVCSLSFKKFLVLFLHPVHSIDIHKILSKLKKDLISAKF